MTRGLVGLESSGRIVEYSFLIISRNSNNGYAFWRQKLSLTEVIYCKNLYLML